MEDVWAENVKESRTSKFAISNSYSITKVMMCNKGKEGHIYVGKFKIFETADILKMIGVYIIDGFFQSP